MSGLYGLLRPKLQRPAVGNIGCNGEVEHDVALLTTDVEDID